jgi:hypothetical protein
VVLPLAPLAYANVCAQAEGVQQLVVQVSCLSELAQRILAHQAHAQVLPDSLCLSDPDGQPWLFTGFPLA